MNLNVGGSVLPSVEVAHYDTIQQEQKALLHILHQPWESSFQKRVAVVGRTVHIAKNTATFLEENTVSQESNVSQENTVSQESAVSQESSVSQESNVFENNVQKIVRHGSVRKENIYNSHLQRYAYVKPLLGLLHVVLFRPQHQSNSTSQQLYQWISYIEQNAEQNCINNEQHEDILLRR
jgi:hypothetical protein